MVCPSACRTFSIQHVEIVYVKANLSQAGWDRIAPRPNTRKWSIVLTTNEKAQNQKELLASCQTTKMC